MKIFNEGRQQTTYLLKKAAGRLYTMINKINTDNIYRGVRGLDSFTTNFLPMNS